MYFNNGLAAVMPPQMPARPGFKVIPVPVELRRRTPGAPALFIVRTRPRTGLGESAFDASLRNYDISALLKSDASGTMNALQWNVESGLAPDPSKFAATLLQTAQAECSGRSWGLPFDRCEVPTDTINKLASDYAAALAATNAQKMAQVSQGDICAPGFVAANPGIQLSARALEGCGYGGGGGQQQSYQQPAAVVAPTVYTPAPAGAAPSAQLSNLTRPGNPFQVGDSYVVVVTGPANSQVAVSGTQNGKSLGTTPVGSTDASGRFQLQGVMDGSTVGTWAEQWTVGGSPAGSVNFTVTAKPAAVAPAGGGGASAPAGSTSNTGSSSSSSGGGSPAASGGMADKTGGVSVSDFFSNTFNVAGYNVPYWGAGLVVIGLGVWAMSRSGK